MEGVFQLKGDHTPQPARESHGAENESPSVSRTSDTGGTKRFSVAKHWTRSFKGLPNQSTCVLWNWRKHSTVSLREVLWVYGVSGSFLLAIQSLNNHCRSSVLHSFWSQFEHLTRMPPWHLLGEVFHWEEALGADLGHAGQIICLSWPGNTSLFPWVSLRRWLGREL